MWNAFGYWFVTGWNIFKTSYTCCLCVLICVLVLGLLTRRSMQNATFVLLLASYVICLLNVTPIEFFAYVYLFLGQSCLFEFCAHASDKFHYSSCLYLLWFFVFCTAGLSNASFTGQFICHELTLFECEIICNVKTEQLKHFPFLGPICMCMSREIFLQSACVLMCDQKILSDIQF
jgi:hypothetical protein